jgi:hypothetical protein
VAQTRFRDFLARAPRRVRDDLREDPHLPYVLLLAAGLSVFWIHHRVPNFATRDEKSRLLDVLVAYGRVIDDPSLESLRNGIAWSRVPFGATVYLFGLALLPVVLAAAILGDLAAIAGLWYPSYEFGFHGAWQSLPAWLWTWSILIVRLFNVAFAVGSVYVTYRIGTVVHDRLVGNLSALLLTLSFGFLTIAHEGGEDMPALFFVLLALYLAIRYVHTDDGTWIIAAGAAGGIAIAFKLTAAPVVVVVGAAFLVRARRAADTRAALVRPWLFAASALAGALCIIIGFPTALVGEYQLVLERVFVGSTSRATHTTGPDAPIWWWFLRGYASGLSLPLLAASAAGVLASVASLARRDHDREHEDSSSDGVVLILIALGAILLLFSTWHDFRVHHLLPTFPLLALLLGERLVAFERTRPAIARPLIAILLLTSGVYAAVGVAGYADMPRDNADEWLTAEADANATVEVYRVDFQDTAVPHHLRVNHVAQIDDSEVVDCPEYIQLGYRDLLYLKEDTYYRNGYNRQRYIRGLLEEETNYEIIAEFGPRPPNHVPQRATPGSVTDLLRYGVVPHTDQFADEQELRANQYTVILERTGPCAADREVPF